MFATFAQCLHPGGLLMFTSGSEHGASWSENGGEALYHASLDVIAYRSLLESHGFQVLQHAVDDAAWVKLGSGLTFGHELCLGSPNFVTVSWTG